MNEQSGNEQSGSALWLILMTVALLAALAIAITRSSGTAEQNGGVEHNRIVASQLMRYASGIEAAIDQMRLRGVSESDLSFDDPALTGYANAACAADDCKIFKTAGGAQSYNLPPGVNDGSPWLFTGNLAISSAGDFTTADLTMLLPGVTATLCQQVDSAAGITSIPVVATDARALPKFTGTYAPLPILATLSSHAGCFSDNNGVDIFYQVLMAR